MHGEREEAPPSNKRGVFTIQDHFNLFARQDGTSPILLPYSDSFVPADIINSNLPIYSIFGHPRNIEEDLIANLLYANLKIKKILEEYAKVQERAQKLLSFQSPTIPTGKMDIDFRDNTPQLSITQKLNLLHDSLAALPAPLSNTYTPEINHIAQIINPQQQSTLPKNLKIETDRQQIARSSTRIESNVRTGMMSTSENTRQTTSGISQQSALSRVQEGKEAPSGNAQLPWILELPSIISNYFFNNKIEALIICFIILMFLNLIFSMRSR